jgi:Na+/proline symporter
MSSIISFDVYGTYIKKRPSDKQLIRASHIGVVGSALFISTLTAAFHKGGVDFNCTIYMLGIVICPGTFPTCFALLWKGQTKRAAIIAPLFGMLCGFAVWFGSAYAYSGEITIISTGKTLPCMFGCLTSSFGPLPTSIIISYI